MIIRNVTAADLQAAAARVEGIRLEVEDRSTSRTEQFRVRLFPAGEECRAISRSGRRKNAVTFHAHLFFFRQLYRVAPAAEIRTTLETYTSDLDLETKFGAVARRIERMGWPV